MKHSLFTNDILINNYFLTLYLELVFTINSL
jgi:hypothetical protein